jgi:hypothetical protein
MTSQICSGYADHVTMTFCKNAFRASTGITMPPLLLVVTEMTEVHSEFLTIIWHTWTDRQSEGQSIQCIVNDPIHTHTHMHACVRLGSTVSSLLVRVFPTSAEDGRVAVTDKPASRYVFTTVAGSPCTTQNTEEYTCACRWTC